MPTTEPRTEAGRAMLAGFAPLPLPEAQELHRRSAMGRRVKVEASILAIEQQATRAALDELETRVRAISPALEPLDVPETWRYRVLDAIRAVREGHDG